MKNMKTSDSSALENKVRELRNLIRLTGRTCPSGTLANARKHLNHALQSAINCPVEKRSVIILEALRKATEELDESRREFHSKHLKSIRENIAEILKKYTNNN
jgi:hypothetical protein